MGRIIAQFDLVEPVLPPFGDVEGLEQGEIGQVEMGVGADHLIPLVGRVERCLHQPEIGMGVVGLDVERALMLIDIIFAAGLARGDEQRRRGRIVGRDQPGFAGDMVAGRDDDPFFR